MTTYISTFDHKEAPALPEPRIENVQGLGAAVVTATATFAGANSWWRGHSLSTWTLCPSVFRAENPGYRYEQNLTQSFMLKARSRYPNCPDSRDASGWLFLMQHFGLYTRLLDWTASVLIATYFAVRHEQYHDQDGAVWALAPTSLNQDQAGTPAFLATSSHPASTLFREALGVHAGEPANCIVATNTSETDIRMLVQKSEFTIHGTSTPIEELPNSENFLLRFVVPSSAKPGLKYILDKFGISEATLFPDLDHLATELRNRRWVAGPASG